MVIKSILEKNKKRTNIFFFIITTLLIIPLSSIKLPMKSKIIKANENSEINNTNTIRSLVQRDLSISNYKYLLMETEICIGTPVQCFNVLYDTGSVYLILGMQSTKLKFKNNIRYLYVFL